MELEKFESDGNCPSCHKCQANDPHSCPFAEDVNDNNDPEFCRCCEACTHECAMGV